MGTNVKRLKPLTSLSRRFAIMAALLAGIAMLAIAGASWWMINQEHTASLRSLQKKDAELQATGVSSHLHAITDRMSELANSSLITNALRDSVEKDRVLIPYLKSIQRIDDVAVDILFTNFEGREIARNGNASFSEQELNWLREKFAAALPASRVQLGEKGEELIAVKFIVVSHQNSAEGALLYKIKLDELALHTGTRLVHGKGSERLLHSPTAIAAAVNVPPVYKHLDFAVLTNPDPTVSWINWQSLLIFFLLAVGLMVMVVMLGVYFGKKLTTDLLRLESFARSVTTGGFRATRAEAAGGLEAGGLEAGGLEVASLTQSINSMLKSLQQEHDKLKQVQDEILNLNAGLEQRVQQRTEELTSYIQGIGQHALISVADLAGDIIQVNDKFCEISGYTEAELLGKNHRIVNSGTHPKEFFVRMWATITQGDVWQGEICNRAKDGSLYWVDSAIVPIKDAQGHVVRFLSVGLNITERKLADDALRVSTGNLNDAQRLAQVGSWGLDLSSGKLSWSDEVFRLFEIDPNQFGATYEAFLNAIHPEDRDSVNLAYTASLANRLPYKITHRLLMSDGRIKWVEEQCVTDFDPDGKPLMSQGTIQDVTERKRAQDEILHLNASLEAQVQQLHSQQEELRQSNEELEQKNQLLAEQKLQVEHKNREIETSRLALQERAEQLALTSKYKSEFLSNMSHELRTPLNSLLILAQMLAENPERNLSEQQIEYAKIIQGAGKDLLELINDILDLSKIESGTVTLELQDVSLADIGEQVERSFRHVAEKHGLGFSVELAPDLPPSFYTDAQRLQQVLKNLLSNAFKFTQQGQVSVRIAAVESGWSVDHDGLNRAGAVIGFFVTDSGIGLAADKQKIIFEAFHQADTGTARKYGGTGLGLSISRELARLFGGELHLVESSLGQGSTFALYVPLRAPESGQGKISLFATETQRHKENTESKKPLDSFTPDATPRTPVAAARVQETNPQPAAIADDRAAIKPGEHTLLIIEDDARFAGILLRAGRDKGFKGIVAMRGDDGLKLADEFKPTAITLDLHLPDMDGWVVLERLKRNPDTRHIPVEIISAEDSRPRGLRSGAFKYLVKPVTVESLQKALTDVNKFTEREMKDLLVVDGDEQHRNTVLDLIGNGNVHTKAVASGKDALAALKKKRYDCIVLDINLPDIPDLLEAIQGLALTCDVPVIVYGMDELPKKEQERLKSLVLKGIVKEVRSPARLLDETALFLHRVVSKLPEERRQMLEKLYLSADSLAGKKVLVVDDDMRNIFALTAVLERHKMVVLSAENGRDALEALGNNPDVDIVLMDIMMPEMDGYEAMRQIRQMKQFETLPMIALTAKAMQGDREQCIAAGASDYVSKPVDTDQLVSLLRVWLYR